MSIRTLCFFILFMESPVIFDISSDEESTWDEPKGEDLNWLKEFLSTVDKELDDPDEVVIVGEVKPPKQSKSKSLKPMVKDVSMVDDHDDDDCVILDGDPDKPVAVVNDTTSECEELLIVGQKGQIACRDYPHPRHHCAEYAFSSTPHERHCDLCHCYVCDSLAPCAYWGTGMSSIDHCHATDKEETWKVQRKDSRLRKHLSLPVSECPAASLSVASPQPNRAPACNLIRVAAKSLPRNQVSKPTTIRTCSTTKAGNANIGGQGRQQSRFVSNKNGSQSHSVSLQLLGVRSNAIKKDRGHILGPQLVSSNTMSQRGGVVGGASAANLRVYGSSNQNNIAHASLYKQNTALLAPSNDKNPTGWQDVCSQTNLETHTKQSSSQPNIDSVFSATAPSQPQGIGQCIPPRDVTEMINHLMSQNQTTEHQGFRDFDCVMAKNSSEMLEQPTVENFQPQSTGPANEFLFDFEDWLLENRSPPVMSEASFSEPITFDAGWLV